MSAATGTAAFSAAKAGSTLSASVGKDSIRYGDQETFAITVQAPGAPAGTDLTGHVNVADGAEIVADEHFRERRTLHDLASGPAFGHPVRFVHHPAREPGPSPKAGEHQDTGFSAR